VKRILSALYSALFPERNSVIIGQEDREVSTWNIVDESTESLTLRKLDPHNPLGTFLEMVVGRDDPRILAIF
jgi:hypothetical protein